MAFGYSILIDPGHGGEDQGTTNTIGPKNKKQMVFEKDIALVISKKLYNKLNKKNHSVYLTRSFDRKVELKERAEMAEKLKADLFISIHVNSGPNNNSNGFETYYLDNHSDVAVKKMEEAENQGMGVDDPVAKQILIDLVIKRTVNSSKKLANSIHSRVKKNVAPTFRMKDRGVRPGLFYVLALSKRPGVLLEVGFLSNDKEKYKILSNKFQEDYTDSIVEGIEAFIKGQKKESILIF